MKIKKMAGALALTAALAMGSVPAFAASVDDDGTENGFSDEGSTTIKARVDKYDENIRATVPLQVTVVFGNSGGGDISGPNATSYKISNIGKGAIAVLDAEITDMNTFFTSAPIEQDGDSFYGENGTTAPTTNTIMLTYKTALNNTYLTTGHALKAAKTGDSTYVSGAKRYSAEEIGVDESLGIDLAGRYFFPTSISLEGQSDTLCKIKYTIDAA